MSNTVRLPVILTQLHDRSGGPRRLPANTRKSAEIVVERDDGCRMADSQGCKVGIVDEVAARPEGPEEFSHHFGVPQGRWGWCDVGPRGPCRDDVAGLVSRQRLCKDAGVGADANERHQAQPWKSNGLTG